MQILANRLCLIMFSPTRKRWLRAGLFIAIGIINISVFVVWIPARMHVNEAFVHANNIWDRTEKAIFAVIDMALNFYFMWLVKTNLVASGLTQYNYVYKYNILMVCFSICFDVCCMPTLLFTHNPDADSIDQLLLIGLMSLPDDAV